MALRFGGRRAASYPPLLSSVLLVLPVFSLITTSVARCDVDSPRCSKLDRCRLGSDCEFSLSCSPLELSRYGNMLLWGRWLRSLSLQR